MITFATRKPSWLATEGYWRVLQVVQWLIFLPLMVLGVVTYGVGLFNFGEVSSNVFWAATALTVGAVVGFFTVRALAWLIVWVIAGFSESKP